MELETLLIGTVAGFIVGALVFTSTGREVSRAAGSRAAYHLTPKKKKKRR